MHAPLLTGIHLSERPIGPKLYFAAAQLRTGLRAAWPLILIVALALALRLPGLVSKPLWYDEAFAILFSDRGPQAMAAGTLATEEGVAADVHPLAYYTALWGWGSLFGTSPAAARLLSVLLGLVVVVLGYLFSRRLFDTRVALIAGLLLAISPFQIHYAQEIRMYTLLAGFLVAATWLYWEALESGRPVYWAGVAVLSAGALYTHNLAGLYLLPLMITPALLGRWRDAANSLLAATAALVLYLPWLVSIPSQVARVHGTYWIAVPGPAELVNTYMTFVSGLPLPDLVLPLALFTGVLIGIIAALANFRGLREGSEGSRRALWLAYLAFAPVALMLVVSQFLPIYIHRAMLGSGVMFAIWLAWSLQTPSLEPLWRRTAVGALALATLIGLIGYYTYRGFPYAPFVGIAKHLERAVEQGEVIVHSNKLSALPTIYYSPTMDQRYLADPSGSGSDTLAPATQQVLGLVADDQVADAVQRGRGVWFLIYSREIADYQSQGELEHPSLAWLRQSYRNEELERWGDLQVHYFTERNE